jgi:hypothetical protein
VLPNPSGTATGAQLVNAAAIDTGIVRGIGQPAAALLAPWRTCHCRCWSRILTSWQSLQLAESVLRGAGGGGGRSQPASTALTNPQAPAARTDFLGTTGAVQALNRANLRTSNSSGMAQRALRQPG